MAYIDFSESENSRMAKQQGIFPLSHWTKTKFLDAAAACEGVTPEKLAALKKIKWSILKSKFLYNSEWHHTSSYFNRTEFYALDEDALEEITLDELEAMATTPTPVKKDAAENYRVRAKYLVWSGSRRYPKATEHEETGTITGAWFVSDSGVRKSISANGFEVIERL